MELPLDQIFHVVTDRTLYLWPLKSCGFVVPVVGLAKGVYLEALTLSLLPLTGNLGSGPGVDRMRLPVLENLFRVVINCHKAISKILLPPT